MLLAALPPPTRSGDSMSGGSEWSENRAILSRRLSEEGPDNFMWWATAHKALVTGPGHVSVRRAARILETSSEWRDGRLREVVMNTPPVLRSGPPSLYTGYGVSGTELLQAYYFLLFSAVFPMYKDMDIIEFGGGFGSFCRICKGMGHTGLYVIYDFPELVEIQKHVLSQCGIKDTEFMQFPDRPLPGAFDCLLSICALSETDVQESDGWIGRDAVMRSSSGARFIVYQGDFGEVDNNKFFPYWPGETASLVTGHELHVAGGELIPVNLLQ